MEIFKVEAIDTKGKEIRVNDEFTLRFDWMHDIDTATGETKELYDALAKWYRAGNKTDRSKIKKDVMREKQTKKLCQIYNAKRIGLKRMAIQKPWMDDRTVNEQYENYANRYTSAKMSAEPTAMQQTVIQNYEAMAKVVEPLFELLDAVRAKIEVGIEAGQDMTALLDKAEAVNLDGLTPAAIAAIKAEFA